MATSRWWGAAAFACLTSLGCENVPKPPPKPVYAVELSIDPATPTAGQEAVFTYRVVDRLTGQPVTDLDVTHERVLHTFIVSDDLEYFQHIHHEDFTDLREDDLAAATFHYPITLPAGGSYHAFAQTSTGCLFPIEGRFAFEVADGGEAALPPASGFDAVRTKTFGDYTVTFRPDPDPPLSSGGVLLNYDLFHTSGEPVTDLGMYLGAEVHVASFREDVRVFGHGHPPAPGDDPNIHPVCPKPRDQVYRGPSVPVAGHFATPGRYKVFATFNMGGDLFQTDFWLRVEP